VSYVPGDADRSGFVSGSTGDRMFFYYHPTNSIKEALSVYGFKIISESEVTFERKSGERELHAIIIAQRIN